MRGIKLLDKSLQRRRVNCALIDERMHRLRIAIVNHAFMAVAPEASHHVGAHSAESDHSNLHSKLLAKCQCLPEDNRNSKPRSTPDEVFAPAFVCRFCCAGCGAETAGYSHGSHCRSNACF